MLRMWALVVFSFFVSDALARGRGMVLNLPPVEDKVLEDNDGIPKWNKGNIRLYCNGRKQAYRDDFEQCQKKFSDDIGHKLTLGENQELVHYRIQSQQKAAARAKQKKMRERKLENDNAPAQEPAPNPKPE